MTTVDHGPTFVPPLTDLHPVLLPDLDEPTNDQPPQRPAAPMPTARLGRLWRGREQDAAWVRPSLISLLAATGLLYLWGLGASGWANAFYSAAV